MTDYTEHLISLAGGDGDDIERPNLTARNKGKVNTIKRRMEHLRERIASAPPESPARDYDKGELVALRFALATVAKHYGIEP